MSEFEKFVTKFRQAAELNLDFQAIMRFVEQIPYEENDTLQGYVMDFTISTLAMLSTFFG